MIGEDEVLLSGKYKDFDMNVKFGLSKASEKDVAYVLSYINESIEQKAFEFSGIKTDMIDLFAAPSGKGLAAVIDFLKTNPQTEIKKQLQAACPVPELMPAAESYMFNRLLAKAGVPFKVQGLQSALKPDKEDVEKRIMFVGKFKEWSVIKKVSINPDTPDWEVSGMLCGVNYTIINKAFDFAGMNKNETLISEVCKECRKSFGNVLATLEKLEQKLPADPLEAAYVVCKSMTGMGYPPYATQTMLVKAYPDIKPPKPKGRMPKK